MIDMTQCKRYMNFAINYKLAYNAISEYMFISEFIYNIC